MNKKTNTAEDHYRRKPPERSDPIRNERPATPEFETGGKSAGGIAFDAVKGSLEYGVQTAYMVIEEYMRRGYDAASAFQPGINWGQDMNQNQYGYGSGDWSANQSTNMGQMSGQMTQWMQMMQMAMQQWMQMLSMMQSMPMPQMQQMLEMMQIWMSSWMTMFSGPGMPPGGYPANPWGGMGMPGAAPFASGMGPGPWATGMPYGGTPYGGMPPNGMPPGFETGTPGGENLWDAGNWQMPPATTASQPQSQPQPTTNAAVRVQVHSLQPTEVIPSLSAGYDGIDLVVDELTAPGVEADPIRTATIKPAHGGGIHVAVVVPPDQPPGRYIGAVKNSTGDYVGGLTVIIHPIASAID